MAFTEFYIQATNGSNLNAGSTTAASSVSVANASWDVTAETYIGLTGTEFSAVNIGDWASIYLDAATVAVYIAQVTVVGALGVSITLSTTAKYGTKPAAGATGRSCKVGGPHLSLTPWNSTGLGATTVPASTRVNIKAETYTRTATDTFSIVGITTGPIWFRGYNTTVGDCESDPTLSKPLISYNATFQPTISGAHHIWSGINFLTARDGTGLNITGTRPVFVRVRAENTSTNAAASAFSTASGSNGGSFTACWAKATSTALAAYGVSAGTYIGCVAEGGLAGFSVLTTTGTNWTNCIVLNSAGVGWNISTAASWNIQFCTVYNAVGDGIVFSTAPTTKGIVVGCAFWLCGGYGINNSSGTNTNQVSRMCNSFWSCTSGNTNGFGDSPSFFVQQESAQPYTSATDMTPVAAALARANGFPPGTFENQSFSSYVNIGAVQHVGGGSGGGGGGLGVM